MTRLIAVLPLMMLVSCATVVTGPYENIEIRSTPSGANAILTCRDGTKTEQLTPATMKLRRKTTTGTMDGAVAVGGVVMIGTATAAFLMDKTTGAMQEHEPNQINVQLKPNN